MSIAVQSCPADISVRRLAAKASPSDSNRLGQHRAHESRPTLRLVDDFGPMCTALQDLPDARLWLEQVGLALYEAATGARVAYLLRYGDGLLPPPDGVLQENDVLHVLVRAQDTAAVERTLTRPPEDS